MKILQFGRSMIEMLGVLAIIGVLSIGGLLGYRRAVNNHQANVILDDVNRFAFVILERSGLALDAEIDKGDFKESGIYTLEGYQDIEPNQFSITVSDVPEGVCEALLPKAAVEYAVRVKEHGSDSGTLYDLFHTDLCNGSNDIVLYFGDTDDLFDFPECGRLPKCVKYSSDCKCIECENGYQLSANGSGKADGQYCVANSCQSTGGECTSNDDCCKSTDFCAFQSPTDCDDAHKGSGVCRAISTYGTGSGNYTKTVNNIKFVRSENNMTWFSAEQWCQRFKRPDGSKMEIANRDDLGCGGLCGLGSGNRYCTKAGCQGSSGTAYDGSVLRLLQIDPLPTWTSGTHWLEEYGNDCFAYDINFDGSTLYRVVRYNDGNRKALCR